MDGLDLAFYQGRSKYHTKYDSMSGANGAKESLWAMLQSARGVGIALLSDDKLHTGDRSVEAPVYFDCECHSDFLLRVAYVVNSVWQNLLCVYTTRPPDVRPWTSGAWPAGFAIPAQAKVDAVERTTGMDEKPLGVGEILACPHLRTPASNAPGNNLLENQ